MIRVHHLVLAAAFIAGLSGGALAQSPAPPNAHAGHQAKASDAASTKEFKDVHIKMMHEMEITYTGNTDVDFVRGMIPHHQGAIDMAKVQLAHGKNAETRSLAQKIIADQEKEIAQMQDWLKKYAK